MIVLLIAASGIAWMVFDRLQEQRIDAGARSDARAAAPVEVAPIESGTITLQRTFSGALEARSEFFVAPKVGGRVERLNANLADPVERGQVVVELDNDEYVQAVAQAEADLAVAEANLAEATSALEIAA